MNQAVRDQRLTYLALTNEGDMLLCDVCRFAEARGSICEGNCYTVCKHKLADYLEPRGYFGMEPGQDCWAFRPSKSIEVVAPEISGAADD